MRWMSIDVSQELRQQQSKWPATGVVDNFNTTESIVSHNLPSVDDILQLAHASSCTHALSCCVLGALALDRTTVLIEICVCRSVQNNNLSGPIPTALLSANSPIRFT